jgi:hypothetical protein
MGTMKKGLKELHKELLHALDQISADLERCTAKQDVKFDPELQDYRFRISKDLDPLRKKIEILALELPLDKDMVVKPKTQGKRMAAIKELKGDRAISKKKKT